MPAARHSIRPRNRHSQPRRRFGSGLSHDTALRSRQRPPGFPAAQSAKVDREYHMSFSGIFARLVALIGGAALLWRRLQGEPPEPAWGSAPVIPEARSQGAVPTLKMPTARGWADGQ